MLMWHQQAPLTDSIAAAPPEAPQGAHQAEARQHAARQPPAAEHRHRTEGGCVGGGSSGGGRRAGAHGHFQQLGQEQLSIALHYREKRGQEGQGRRRLQRVVGLLPEEPPHDRGSEGHRFRAGDTTTTTTTWLNKAVGYAVVAA